MPAGALTHLTDLHAADSAAFFVRGRDEEPPPGSIGAQGAPVFGLSSITGLCGALLTRAYGHSSRQAIKRRIANLRTARRTSIGVPNERRGDRQ